MPPLFIGIDIGGTKLSAAAADGGGRILRRARAATPLDLEEGLALIEQMIATVSEGAAITGIGAAAGGPLDWRTGVISPLHQPQWRGIPLKSRMEALYGCPFAVDVDTNAAALAENHFASRPVSKLLYITISTGMGGGFIVDGSIYRGMNGGHPEVGHQAVPYRAPAGASVHCPCGSTGCLEALVSGSGIRRLYGVAPEELRPEQWLEVAWNLGQGLRNLAAIYLPDAIVLGGGVALGAGGLLIEPAVRIMKEHLKIVPHPHVSLTELGEENVLRGAILFARQAALNSARD